MPISTRGSALRSAARLARRNVMGVAGALVVLVLVVIAIFAPQLSPHDPNAQVGKRLTEPNAQYPLGLDQLGRDELSRIVFGARVSLVISVTSVALALAVGATIGLVSGYYGGWFDTVAMRVMDLMFTLPSFVLALALTGILGAELANVIFAIAFVTIPSIARITRAPVLTVREAEYVAGARVAGARDSRILFRHVLPNVMAPLIVQTTVSIADAILIEAALSFLGLGVQPPDTSWGLMLGTGRNFMEIANGLSVFPGIAIMLAVLGFNFAGDGLRDLLDPRLRTA
jgi:peptide/nickel transport system permease protein